MRIDLFDVPQVNILVMCAFSTNNTTVINDTTNKFTSIFRFLNERWKSKVKESIYFKRLRLILIFRTCHLFLILFVLKTSQISKTVKFSVTTVILVDNHAVLLIHSFKKRLFIPAPQKTMCAPRSINTDRGLSCYLRKQIDS